jgi:hypothetical protein
MRSLKSWQASNLLWEDGKQMSYAQEFQALIESWQVSANSSLKALHPFIDQEGIFSGRTVTKIFTFLSNNTANDLATKTFHAIGCLRRIYKASLCWAANFNSIASSKTWILRRNLVKAVIHQWQPGTSSRCQDHYSSWVSYHQLECNPRDHYSPLAYTIEGQSHDCEILARE